HGCWRNPFRPGPCRNSSSPLSLLVDACRRVPYPCVGIGANHDALVGSGRYKVDRHTVASGPVELVSTRDVSEFTQLVSERFAPLTVGSDRAEEFRGAI